MDSEAEIWREKNWIKLPNYASVVDKWEQSFRAHNHCKQTVVQGGADSLRTGGGQQEEKTTILILILSLQTWVNLALYVRVV